MLAALLPGGWRRAPAPLAALAVAALAVAALAVAALTVVTAATALTVVAALRAPAAGLRTPPAAPVPRTSPATLVLRPSPSAPDPRASPSAPDLPASQPECAEAEAGREPSPDLYCIVLSPTPAVSRAGGAVRLRRAPSPFGTSVTADGVHRWDLALSVEGLPDPASLGPYRTYVAWATTPLLKPVVRLGRVGNGNVTLGPLALNAFLILVSAEASGEATVRTGPLVLRGASASVRLQPHDLVRVLAGMGGRRRGAVPADAAGDTGAAGAGRRPAAGATEGLGDAHGIGASDGMPTEWPEPPMHPAISMPPGLMDLRPDVAPFLPAAHPDSVPRARPPEIVDVADGDTLALVAGPIRRTLRGRTYVMYGFNGRHPGPLVRVPRGASVVVAFENRTEWPTAVHWHGVRLDNASDGVPGVTQDPVPPGGRFTYRVRFPDSGIYWYHPHHREDVQQDLGLYGNIRVREPASGPAPVNREEVLMLDDLLVGESGLVPWGKEGATHALMGRFGNVLLVNGEPRYELSVDQGAVVRFYLTNASNARTWNVSFQGAPMKVVAADVGPFEREERVESVVLAPAERYVVDVFFAEARPYAFVNAVQALDSFGARFFAEVDTLGIARTSRRRAEPDLRGAFETLRTDTAATTEIDRYREAFSRPVDRELVLTLDAGRLPFPIQPILALESVYANPVEWSGTMPEMNGAVTVRGLRWVLRDPVTGAENGDVDWRFREGDLVKVRLTSDRGALHPMQHPIHIHGQRFLVLSQGGSPQRNLAWKDTLLLPAGDSAEILLELSNPGRWMLHCHIAEHLEAGMSTVFTVDPSGDRVQP